MRRSEDRILTTHTGSLIRPADLIAAAEAAERDENKAGGYERALTSAVAEVVARQADTGLDAVNDGEFGKSSWAAYIIERLSGYEVREDQLKPLDWLGRDRDRFRGFFTDSDELPALDGLPTEACVGPIRYVGKEAVERDLANLAAASGDDGGPEAFFTSVAPASTAYQGVNEHYKTEEEYVYAIADALRHEYQAIHRAGFLLQVDDAVLANFYDHLIQDGEQSFRRWAGLRVEALNHALEGIPEDRIRYHVCFGSWHVPHVADAPLEALVEFILRVNAGAYAIEAANPRHEWEWEVWERTTLPDGKTLIPGVVTHHTTTVEHPRLVAQRIERYARIVGRENVIAGTDCGFAQVSTIQRTHPEVMWAKLASLVEGAKLASQRLWD